MALAEISVESALAALGARAEPAAGGVAAALAAAAAAALVELTAGLAAARLAVERPDDRRGAAELEALAAQGGAMRERLIVVADEDAAAYSRLATASDAGARAQALAAAGDPPLEIAETSAELAAAAARIRAAGEWPFSPDAAAAAELAAAAARVASGLVAADLAGLPHDPRHERSRAAAERAERLRDTRS